MKFFSLCDNRNEQLMDNNFPLENINRRDINHNYKTNGDSIFSTCDFSQSFFQEPYDRKSRPIMAFTYKNRRYQICIMTIK